MIEVNAKPFRRLPVWIVVRRSFTYAWESRYILALPYAIYAAITIMADILIGYAADPGNNTPAYAVSAVEEIFAMAFAVGIHRYVLLGEVRSGLRFFRWDRHFLQYVLTALSLFLVGLMVLLVAIGLSKGQDLAANPGAMGFVTLFMMSMTVWVGLCLCRMSLMLPSAALGDNVAAKTIWRETMRNGFRIFAATLLAVAPFLIVQGALVRLYPSTEGLAGLASSGIQGFVVMVLIGLISPLQLIVLTTALSLQYDILVRGRGPAAQPA
jgi:hypothetical protein